MAHYFSPMVIEKAKDYQVALELNSKLLQNNIIFLQGEITDQLADSVQNQLLYLSSKTDNKTIKIHINSPGGSVYAGLGIYDMMQFVKSKGFTIETICTGVAMSMGAVLLVAGTAGKRKMFPNSTVMLHQASSGFWGNALDAHVQHAEFIRLNELMLKIVSEHTNILDIKAVTERDYFITSEEAIKLSIVDSVLC